MHNIITDKAKKYWTPFFSGIIESIAKTTITELKPFNLVPVKGHYGPHGDEYHKIISSRLQNAIATGHGNLSLIRIYIATMLVQSGIECMTPGFYINSLITHNGISMPDYDQDILH